MEAHGRVSAIIWVKAFGDISIVTNSFIIDRTSDNGEHNMDIDGIPTRVFKDIFHLMDMIPISKSHSMAKEFYQQFRDALFVYDRADRANVELHLRSQNQTWKQTLLVTPNWIHKRVKRIVPQPEELLPVVRNLFNSFGSIECSRSGFPLFNREARKQAENVLSIIEAGHVSDPLDIALYFECGTDRHGLTLYRCARGTNSIEGGVHQNVIRKFGSFGASPQLVDCSLAEYRLRHNIDVSSFCFCWYVIGISD